MGQGHRIGVAGRSVNLEGLEGSSTLGWGRGWRVGVRVGTLPGLPTGEDLGKSLAPSPEK